MNYRQLEKTSPSFQTAKESYPHSEQNSYIFYPIKQIKSVLDMSRIPYVHLPVKFAGAFEFTCMDNNNGINRLFTENTCITAAK